MVIFSQLTDIKSSIDRTVKLKFRGCNHPSPKNSRGLHRNLLQNTTTGIEYGGGKGLLKSRHFMNESMVLNYLNNTNRNTKIGRKHFTSPPKSPVKARPEEQLYTTRYVSSKIGNQEETKTFPRSESLETFPPFAKHFVRHQHSRSP